MENPRASRLVPILDGIEIYEVICHYSPAALSAEPRSVQFLPPCQSPAVKQQSGGDSAAPPEKSGRVAVNSADPAESFIEIVLRL
jgi:hypothetical protein